MIHAGAWMGQFRFPGLTCIQWVRIQPCSQQTWWDNPNEVGCLSSLQAWVSELATHPCMMRVWIRSQIKWKHMVRLRLCCEENRAQCGPSKDFMVQSQHIGFLSDTHRTWLTCSCMVHITLEGRHAIMNAKLSWSYLPLLCSCPPSIECFTGSVATHCVGSLGWTLLYF